MLPDPVSNPGPLTYESGALPIALRGPALVSGHLLIIKIDQNEKRRPVVLKSLSEAICTLCKSILTWKPVKGSRANSADPDQILHKVASVQGLQCLGFAESKNRIKRQNRQWTYPKNKSRRMHLYTVG